MLLVVVMQGYGESIRWAPSHLCWLRKTWAASCPSHGEQGCRGLCLCRIKATRRRLGLTRQVYGGYFPHGVAGCPPENEVTAAAATCWSTARAPLSFLPVGASGAGSLQDAEAQGSN